MPKLLAHIEAFLTKHKVQRIIVACSGGLDSTVLLHACAQLNIVVEVAHVNYQLRGQESNQDQDFLEQLANSFEIPIHVKKIDLNESLKNGGNLQDLARNERYQFFHELSRTAANTFVLLGHHQEDQTETFFMNLARNSGVMGLAAMPPKRGVYLRPLLCFSKQDLKDYAKMNAIQWREDSSNQSLKYTRNEWRNVVLPELRKELPDLDASVQVLTQIFQEKQSELGIKIRAITEHIIQQKSLPASTFASLDAFEVVELCRQLEQPIGISETWTQLTHKGTFVDLQPNDKVPFHKVFFDGDSYSFLTHAMDVKMDFKTEEISSLPKQFTKNEVYIDSDLIQGELHMRPVQTGDRIHPIGMTGSRLVSDVVSDAKLTSLQKQNLHLLVDDNHVLWVPQLCVSRKAIASNKSKKILKISLD